MKRFLLLLLVLAVGVAAAAFYLPSSAATVDGTSISEASLDSQLAAIGGSPGYQCYLDVQYTVNNDAQSTTLLQQAIKGTSTGTYGQKFVAGWLFQMVESQVLAQMASARHVAITATDLANARTTLDQGITSELTQLEASTQIQAPAICHEQPPSEVAADLPSSFHNALVRSLAVGTALEPTVIGYQFNQAGEQRFFDANRSEFDSICVQEFLTSSQTAAEALQSKLTGASAVAAAAASAATGTTGGGCISPTNSSYASIAEGTSQLTPGQTTTQESEDGYIVIYLKDRTSNSFSSVASAVHEELVGQAQAALQSLVESTLREHEHIAIDPLYGAWSSTEGVVSPTSPGQAFVLNPSANTPLALRKRAGSVAGSSIVPSTSPATSGAPTSSAG